MDKKLGNRVISLKGYVVLAFALCSESALQGDWLFSRGDSSSLSSNVTTTGTPSPVIMASTYLGGPGYDIAWACASDASGNMYVAGDTQQAGFPVSAGALQTSFGGGGQDGFVSK